MLAHVGTIADVANVAQFSQGVAAPTLRRFVGVGEHHAVPLRCCGTDLSRRVGFCLFEVQTELSSGELT